MALLKFISLSVGSLLLLQGAYGDDAGKLEPFVAAQCLPFNGKLFLLLLPVARLRS